MNAKPDIKILIKDKFASYTDTSKAKRWLESNLSRVKQLFENYTLRDYVFELFCSTFLLLKVSRV